MQDDARKTHISAPQSPGVSDVSRSERRGGASTGTLYASDTDLWAGIDRRNTRYRFDLERDMPWDQLDVPGLHLGDKFLRSVGFDVDGLRSHPEAWERFQWAAGLEIASAFSILERYLIEFVHDEELNLQPSKSLEHFCEEERKHIALFDRYADHLRARHPAWVAGFELAFEPYRPALLNPYTAEVYPNRTVQHYFFWLKTLFFEEYTIYLYDCLMGEDEELQPAWVAAHRLHRKEELQHAITDAAYLEGLEIDPVLLRACATAFWAHIEQTFELFLGVAATRDWVASCYPEVARYLPRKTTRNLPIFRDIATHPTFRRTRLAAPGLSLPERLSELDGPALPDPGVQTLPEALDRVIAAHPSFGITWIKQDGTRRQETYGELKARALRLWGALKSRGMTRQQHVVIAVDEPEEAVGVVWACLLGGLVPVPLGAALGGGARSDGLAKAAHVLGRLGPGSPLVAPGYIVEMARPMVGGAIPLWTFDELAEWTEPAAASRVSPSDMALIQFSSGSTGWPKGVQLRHTQLLSNMFSIICHQRGQVGDQFVSWLPLFHDMGLIGYHLLPILNQANQAHMHPLHFVRRPMDWLQVLHDLRATVTASPNFGFAHTLKRLDVDRLASLDLSSLHCILNGAEPIAKGVVDRFVDALRETGLRTEVVSPGYGLAEGTLCIAAKPKGTPTRAVGLARATMSVGQRVTRDPDGVQLVSCGDPVHGVSLRLVDDEGAVVEAGCVGHIQIRGPNITEGYQGDAAATEALFDQGWLRTGDLGVILDGELVVTGRVKDVLFMHGRNLYSHDIERVIEGVDGVLPGRVCAFAVPEDEGESVGVALAIREGHDVDAVVRSVCAEVGDVIGVRLEHVAIVDPKGIPRTSSGKLQRGRVQSRYLAGKLERWAPRPEPEEETSADALVSLVRQTWAVALEVSADDLALDVSFGSLGGSSLQAAHVHAQLEDHLHVAIEHAMLMEANSIEEMAAWLVARGLVADAAAEEAPMPVEVAEAESVPAPVFAEAEPRDMQTPDAAPLAPTPPVVSPVDVRAGDVAIVGIGLRLPGASSPRELWSLLREGRSAVQPVPTTRWRHDRMTETLAERSLETCPTGAFMSAPMDFDAGAFGLETSKAQATNPQVRLFLDVSAEALEDAGVGRGSVGVFVSQGEQPSNFRTMLDALERGDEDLLAQLDDATNDRVAATVCRTFDLQGPAMVVQAACAASLVAVHQARRALQHGECEAAVVGGVELLHTPTLYAAFAPAGVLSRQGACRPFSDEADGFVPGEGAVAIVLEPLDRALAAGRHIYGVLRGSAVVQDGRPFSSMAPSPEGQRTVAWAALEEAGIDPASVGMIESHGTGTPVGDAVEVRALSDVYGPGEGRCALTAVKASLGHGMSVAGVTGLVAATLAVHEGAIPPIAGLEKQGCRHGWSGRVMASTALTPWQGSSPRRAAVHSKGLAGTSAHVIVEQAPEAVTSSLAGAVMVLGARDDAAVRRHATRVAQWWHAHPEATLSDVAATLARGAMPWSCRVAGAVSSRTAALRWLEQVAAGELAPVRRRDGVVLLCPGPGSQYVGMANELAEDPVYQAAWRACDAVVEAELGVSLGARVAGDEGGLDDIRWSQPAVFAVSWATLQWLESLGVQAEAVVGHSAGEYAAMAHAGVMSMEDALRVLIARGEAMANAPSGGMMVVFEGPGSVEGHPGVTVAADNGPRQCVVSGAEAALQDLARLLAERGVATKRLSVGCAAHSPAMESALGPLQEALERATLASPSARLISSRTGGLLAEVEPDHLLRQLVEPVRFRDAIQTALHAGYRHFVEVGAAAVLAPAVQAVADEAGVAVQTSAVHRRTSAGVVWEALASLVMAGQDLRLGRLLGAGTAALPGWRQPVTLPFPLAEAQVERARAARSTVPLGQPLTPAEQALFADHPVQGMPLAPAAWMLGRLLADAELPAALRHVVVKQPLQASEGFRWRLAHRGPDVTLVAREGSEHMTARWATVEPARAVLPCPSDAVDVSTQQLYGRLAERGLQYGPRFQTIQRVRRAGDVLWVDLEGNSGTGDVVDPVLLDGAFHSLAVFDTLGDEEPALGFAMGQVTVRGPLVGRGQAVVVLRSPVRADMPHVRADLTLLNAAGEVVLEVVDFCAKRRVSHAPRAFTVGTSPVSLPAAQPPAGTVAVVADPTLGLNDVVDALWDAEGTRLLGPFSPDDTRGVGHGLRRAETVLLVEPSLGTLPDLLTQLGAASRLTVVSSSRAVRAMSRSFGAETALSVTTLAAPGGVVPAEALWAAVASGRGALTWTGSGWAEEVLQSATLPSPHVPSSMWILGATRGIGRALAERVAGPGRTLVLSGRSTFSDAWLAQLRARGATVMTLSLDLSDADAVHAAVDHVEQAYGPMDVVVHSAGVVDDGPLHGRSADRIRAVMAPKDVGAAALAEALAERGSKLVLLGSLTAHVPSPGQADYAAANARLVEVATAARFPVTCISSGPWGEVGAVADEVSRARMRALGLPPMPTRAGLDVILSAAASPLRSVVVTCLGTGAEGRMDALVRGVVPEPSRDAASARPEPASIANKRSQPAVEPALGRAVMPTPSSSAAEPRLAGGATLDVEAVLRRELGKLLPGSEHLELSQPFSEMGVDSLMAVSLVRALDAALGCSLHTTLLFEHPTPEELLRYLRQCTPMPAAPMSSPPVPPVIPSLDAGADGWWVDQSTHEPTLSRRRVSVPPPGADEVAISVEAWGVNFIDVLGSSGLHPMISEPDFPLGHEVAGQVVAVGSAVQGVQVGDRVVALVPRGGFATRVNTLARLAIPVPAGWSAEEAVSLLVTGLTAIACIEEAGRVRAGERVLVQSAAGATGLATAQLAKLHGATVLGTASTREKVERLHGLVDHGIVYTEEALDAAVRARVGHVDVLVDALSGDAIRQGLSVLAEGGRFVEIGAGEAVQRPAIDPRDLFLRGQSFHGVNLGSLMKKPSRLAPLLQRLAVLLREGALQPVVGHRVRFEALPDALALLRSRRTVGKVVVHR